MVSMGQTSKEVISAVGAIAISTFTAASLIGWARVWDWLTGWYTQGWGNLSTVAIAALAIGVSAWFNLKTLNQSKAQFDRTVEQSRTQFDESITDSRTQFEQSIAESHAQFEHSIMQFEQVRIDTLTDKLRSEIIGLINGFAEKGSRTSTVARRVSELYDTIDPSRPDVQPVLEQNLQAIVQEELGAVYRAISGHHFAILLLCDDSELKKIVATLATLAAEDRQAWESTGPNSDPRALARDTKRENDIAAEIKKLMSFSHRKIGPSIALKD